MRRFLAAVVMLGLLPAGLAGCAGSTGAGSEPPPGPTRGSDADLRAAFEERAAAVAAAWQGSAATGAWRTGFVPLAELTVPPRNGFPDGEMKMAFVEGRYATRVALPEAVPAPGTVRFPDGSTLSAPLVGARDAYAALDKGAPPCTSGAPAQPTTGPGAPGSGPDQPTGTSLPQTCAVLTVTAVTLGETRLRTSRGEAAVPAWLFTIAGLGEPVARVAVSPSAVRPAPTPSLPPPAVPGLVTAQDIESIDGARLVYRLTVGACDYDIRPLVYETAEVVVVGGSVRTRPGACPAIAMMAPVTVTLAEPVGARPVLDAGTGAALTVR